MKTCRQTLLSKAPDGSSEFVYFLLPKVCFGNADNDNSS